MNRIAVVLSVLAPLAVGAVAAADPAPITAFRGADGTESGVQYLPRSSFTEAGDMVSPIIFVNRCKGGCMLKASTVNNAATQESTIPQFPAGTMVSVPEFPYDDAAWAFVMQCVKEVYSPFNVQITDVDPGASVVHHEIVVAGTADTFNLPSGFLGISPVSVDHSPVNNNISFAFAGSYSNDQNIDTRYGLYDLCATIGQETAHSWGLDHEFSCTDPMTYLPPCGGQRFFRNEDIQCGTAKAGECNCDGQCSTTGGAQNSHQRILAVFGPGQSIVPGPTATVALPANGDKVQDGFALVVNSTAKRGTFKVTLSINGWQWLEKDISANQASGSVAAIYANTFTLQAPAGVPDGVMDLEVKACDDLDQCATNTLTVTKGDPCVDASKCAAGQKCDAGKCYWDPPSKQLGDACMVTQECLSGLCLGVGDSKVCSQKCYIGQPAGCPDGFTCTLAGASDAYCLAAAPPQGCCSAGDTGLGSIATQGGLAGLVLAIAVRRRRRRAAA
jgi:MYXO-CTERM domain-containing protein